MWLGASGPSVSYATRKGCSIGYAKSHPDPPNGLAVIGKKCQGKVDGPRQSTRPKLPVVIIMSGKGDIGVSSLSENIRHAFIHLVFLRNHRNGRGMVDHSPARGSKNYRFESLS